MKTYKANRKGFINYLLIGFLLLPILIFFLDRDIFTEKSFAILPFLLPFLLMLWLYVDTSYKIDKNKLYYRSGFLQGEIDIPSIKEIVKGKTMWSGLKPALATKGLILKYNKYDEIYIAPQSNNELTSDLIKINSNITIVED